MKLPPDVREGLASRLETVGEHFPEMPRRLAVGLTRFYDGLAFQSTDGRAKLLVDVHRTRRGEWRYPTCWTVAHEMMHLAQFNAEGIPSGERATDIYALARLGPELIDDSPSYLVIDKETRDRWGPELAGLANSLAKEAIRKRGKGLRNYASWWEDEFEAMTAPNHPGRKKEGSAGCRLCGHGKRARRDSNP